MARPVAETTRLAALGAAMLVASTSCTGVIGDPGDAPRPGDEPVPPGVDRESVLAQPDALGPVGVRRLSRREYVDTVRALTGVDISDADLAAFPADSYTPFDNDYDNQLASETLVEGLRGIAERVAQAVLADPALRAAVVPCAPDDADEACLRQFVEQFGRRALRRPMTDEELADYTGVAATVAEEVGDFDAGVSVVMQALLQDASFIYRVETGKPVEDEPNLLRLDDHEVASRLSFLLWGTGPDEALLDLAEEDDALEPGPAIRSVASSMLADPRARDRVTRFFAMWLGYELPLPVESLDASMRRESATLVERVVFDEQSSMLDIFTSSGTFVDAELAESYGLPEPASPDGDWVTYSSSGRQGILSHATFLSNGVKAGLTSPTLRGLYVRLRLTCEEVPPPPPDLMVDVDEPPPGLSDDDCKSERYAVHATNAACSGCHEQMDPIGFGLESYDALGRFRATEEGRPDCPVEGEGELSGIGTFRGPGELADLLITSGRLETCFAEQLFRFVMGRQERTEDRATIEALTEHMRELDHRFDALLLDLVSLPAFRYRVIDEEGL